jgi:hypothetical protein
LKSATNPEALDDTTIAKAQGTSSRMNEYEGFDADDWLDDDDLPDEDERIAGTGDPVHAVSNVYPFECAQIEHDRAIPNNPYDLHLDEAIRLTPRAGRYVPWPEEVSREGGPRDCFHGAAGS